MKRLANIAAARGPRAAAVGQGFARAAAVAVALYAGIAIPAHAAAAIAQYDQPKYPADFTHFAYTDPGAPDNGVLTFPNYSELQSYDSLNPFLMRGAPAPDIQNLMFDNLMQRSGDELASEYALIADDVQIAPDRLSATFHINPKARFNNGDPIMAADVKYSLDMLKSDKASPTFNTQFAVIKDAVVLDPSTVRFDFAAPDRGAPLIAGDVPVFSRKWGLKPDGTRIPFDQLSTVPPISSGQYLIESRKDDKQITYRRNPDYWAKNLPTRKGMFHFARITFKLYLDDYTRLESFKAGDIDVNVEYSATQWARKYVGKNFRNGLLIKGMFPTNPAQMQGMIINTRRPLFKDPRVRQALALAFDYDWMNRLMFYGQYVRNQSFFDRSPFAATGMPGPDELKLLEPLRASVPPEVFGPMLVQPSTVAPSSQRDNLKRARDLLAQAGWHYRDGALRNAQGTPFAFEINDDQPGMDRLYLPYIQALGLLGMKVTFRELDAALFEKRETDFDFDMTTYLYLPVTIPGQELQNEFSSAAAAQKGSLNYPGVRSPAVDALLGAVKRATTLAELEAATRALDRVLIYSYYMVPEYYAPNNRIAYKRTIGHPAILPTTYQDVDLPINYWYEINPGKPAGAPAQ